MAKNPSLARAIAIVGTQERLAERIGTTQSNVQYWLHKAVKGTPPEFCAAIEEATDGAVPRHEQRPDVFLREGEKAA